MADDPWAVVDDGGWDVVDDSNDWSVVGEEKDKDAPGILKVSGAAATRATLGMSEMIFRTPDSISRFGRAVHSSSSRGPKTSAAMEKIWGGVGYLGDLVADAADFVANDFGYPDMAGRSHGMTAIADRISYANQALPELFPAFEELDKQGVKANDAISAMMEGDFEKLGSVVKDPKVWAAFTAEAIPTLYAAWKSGGSMSFMAWMEGMDQATSAADFERRTGERIDDEDFASAVALSATVNAFLEKIGLDSVTSGRGSILTRLAAGSQIEGFTEVAQEVVQNTAGKIYDGDRKLTEGLLQAYMGGAGAGGTLAVATGAAEGLPVAPKLPSRGPKPDGEPGANQTVEPTDQSDAASNDVPEPENPNNIPVVDPTDQAFQAEPPSEKGPLARYVFMPSETRKKGNIGEVRELDEALFIRHVRPFLTPNYANTVDEYKAKHPNATHVLLTRTEDKPWKPEKIGPQDKVANFAGTSMEPYARQVSSFDQPEVATWLNQKRSEVKRDPSSIDPAKDDLLAAISKMGGLSKDVAASAGIDEESFGLRGHGIKRVFTKGGRDFDGMAEALSELGYPVVDESGSYGENALLDSLSRALSGEDVRTPQGAEVAADERLAELEKATYEQPAKAEEVTLDDAPSMDDLVSVYESIPDYDGSQVIDEAFFSYYPPDFDQKAKNLTDLAAMALEVAGEDAVDDALTASTDEQAASELWTLINQGRSAATTRSGGVAPTPSGDGVIPTPQRSALSDEEDLNSDLAKDVLSTGYEVIEDQEAVDEAVNEQTEDGSPVSEGAPSEAEGRPEREEAGKPESKQARKPAKGRAKRGKPKLVETDDGNVEVTVDGRTTVTSRLEGESDEDVINAVVKANKDQDAIDEAAHKAATSPDNDLPQPTQAQKEANGEGNYKLGDPVKVQGVTWRVENPKGSYRFNFDEKGWESIPGSGPVLDLLREGKVPQAFRAAEKRVALMDKGSKGTKALKDAQKIIDESWFNKMPAHYSRAVGVKAYDGDMLDAFLGPKASDASAPVFVVNTVRLGDPKEFDEHKVMIGYEDESSALAAFDESYDAGIAEKIKLKGNPVVELSPAEFSEWIESEGPVKGEIKPLRFGKADAQRAVYEAASKLSVKAQVFDSVDSMPDSSLKESIKSIKGQQPRAVTAVGGSTVVFSENISDSNDAIALLLHETVAHNGIKSLIPKNSKVKKLTDEQIADDAESGKDTGVLKTVHDSIKKELKRIGVSSDWSKKELNALISQSRKRVSGKPLDEVTISEDVEVEETGEQFVVDSKADVLLRQHDKRVGVIQSLRECVS